VEEGDAAVPRIRQLDLKKQEKESGNKLVRYRPRRSSRLWQRPKPAGD